MKKHKIIASLGLSSMLALSSLYAEDDGYFVSVGYQLGGSTQIAKNTGAIKNLNDRYQQLNQDLASVLKLKQSIANANNTQLITSAVTNVKSFANNNYNLKNDSPIFNATQALLTSVLAFWKLIGDDGTKFWVDKNCATDGSNHQSTCNEVGGRVSETTFKKMTQEAEKLQSAILKLCPLSGCSNNGATHQVQQAALTTTETSSQGKSAEQQKTTNTITEALKAAQDLMSELQKSSPWIKWDQVKIKNQTDQSQHQVKPEADMLTNYEMFKNVNAMLPLLQQMISLSQTDHTETQNLQSQATGSNRNQDFVNKFYNVATNQATILANSQKIFQLFSSIPKNQLYYMEHAYQQEVANLGGTQGATTGSQSQSQGNDSVKQNIIGGKDQNNNSVTLTPYIDAIQRNITYYGDQVQTALGVANDVYFLEQNKTNIEKTFADASQLSKELSATSYNKLNLSEIITANVNKNAPESEKYNYNINQSQHAELRDALAAMANNPFRNVGILKSQSNNGVMNGIGIQAGYKQFFGPEKRWGARYYGFFDYNHTYISSNFFSSASNVLTYGAASDFLYNFINDRQMTIFGKSGKFSFGGYAGIALAGTSWINSDKAVFLNTPLFNASDGPYKASVSSSNFQFLFNFGLRVNFAEASKGKHAIQHGIDFGIKIPTVNTSYYSFMGAKLSFRRTFSFYLNYVFAY
nr:outer membrane protein [Helicobacter cetorum]